MRKEVAKSFVVSLNQSFSEVLDELLWFVLMRIIAIIYEKVTVIIKNGMK